MWSLFIRKDKNVFLMNIMTFCNPLTHWGWVTHICVNKLTRIGADNGLSPGRRQAIIWTSAGIMLNRPVGTKFSEMLIEIPTFSFKKLHLKMSSVKWRPFYVGLNIINPGPVYTRGTNLQISKFLYVKVYQWLNSLTWVNFNPSMDK